MVDYTCTEYITMSFGRKKLVQDGIDTEKMGSSWLIPVYLYKRAEILNHSPVYLWVWIATFVISFII